MPIACRFAFAAAKKESFENVGLRNSAENVPSAANEECLDRFQKKVRNWGKLLSSEKMGYFRGFLRFTRTTPILINISPVMALKLTTVLLQWLLIAIAI